MSRQIETGTLFFIFGLVLFGIQSGAATIGPFSYNVDINFFRVAAVVAIVISAYYLFLIIAGILKREWGTKLENFIRSHIPTPLIYPAVALYVSAFFIVYISGLAMGVGALSLTWLKLPLLIVGMVWLFVMGLSHNVHVYRISKAEHQSRISSSGESNWLGKIVHCEMDRRKPSRSLKETMSNFSAPSIRTILCIIAMLAISIVLSWLLSIWLPGQFVITATRLPDFYLTMWQVQGALAAIALPVLVIVIEFSWDLRYTAIKIPQVLIRKTWVFPIIALALAGTVRLGIDVLYFQIESVFWTDLILVFIGTICLTVFAYYRMISTLLNPITMRQSYIALLKGQMDLQLDNTLERRIADYQLRSQLRKLDIELQPYSVTSIDEQKYIILKSSQRGVLSNINLGKLKSFIKNLPFAISESVSTVASEEGIAQDRHKDLPLQSPKQHIWWMKLYRQEITDEDPRLMLLDKQWFNVANSSDLEMQLNRLIEVSNVDKENELRIDLSHIRDSLMDSIRECKTGALQEGLRIYEELIDTFLDKLKLWDATYKKDQAIKESTSIRGGWGEIKWISDDLREVIEMAMRIEHVGIIEQVINLPVRMALKAFSHGDYYIFHQFLKLIVYCYWLALQLKNRTFGATVTDYCSIRLTETLRYFVIPKLERVKSDADVDEIKDYAQGILVAFSQLFKNVFDKNDVANFKALSATIHSVFEFYFKHNNENELNSLQYLLNTTQLTSPERAKIEKQLQLKRKQLSAAKELREAINSILYGLNAWALHKYLTGKMEVGNFQKWDAAFRVPGNLDECWYTLTAALKRENQDDFQWSFWEFEEHNPSVLYAGVTTFWVGFANYLRILFCAQSLKVLGKLDAGRQVSERIPCSPDIIWLAEAESSPFRQILKQIDRGANSWEAVIGWNGLWAVPALEQILDKAVREQIDKRNSSIKIAELSTNKIQSVKNEILQAWEGNSEFRQIVNIYKSYEFVDKPPEKMHFFGINELQPKEMYIADDVAIEGIGAQLGRDLATAENTNFVEKLMNNLDVLNRADEKREPIAIISRALSRLENDGCSPIVMILNSWETYYAISKSEKFSKEDNQPDYGLVGKFRSAPVYYLHCQAEPCVVVVDLRKFCVWRQFRPRQLYDGEEYICKELTFFIKSFTEESARETIKNSPKLLEKQDGSKKSEDETIADLQLHVHFRLLEQYEIEIINRSSGYKITAKL